MHTVRIAMAMCVVAVAVVMAVWVFLWADVLHLVDATALWAALKRAVAGHSQPDDTVRVGGAASAASELLVAERLDGDWVFKRAWTRSHPTLALHLLARDMGVFITKTARIQRPHVKDIHTLHLAENFQTLQTRGLLEIGGDGTAWGARWDEVVFGLDACEDSPQRSAIEASPGPRLHILTVQRLQQLAFLANSWISLLLACIFPSVSSAMFLFRETLDGRTSSGGDDEGAGDGGPDDSAFCERWSSAAEEHGEWSVGGGEGVNGCCSWSLVKLCSTELLALLLLPSSADSGPTPMTSLA